MTHYDDAKESFRCEHGKVRGSLPPCAACERDTLAAQVADLQAKLDFYRGTIGLQREQEVKSLTEQVERLTRERDELKVSHAEYVFALMQARAAELKGARLEQEKAEALAKLRAATASVADWAQDALAAEARAEAAERRCASLEEALREIASRDHVLGSDKPPLVVSLDRWYECTQIAKAALAEGRTPQPEPDEAVGPPYTEAQMADMRRIALAADLRHARQQLEAHGYTVSTPQPEPKA
jgi:chromosome segregation ATPase